MWLENKSEIELLRDSTTVTESEAWIQVLSQAMSQNDDYANKFKQFGELVPSLESLAPQVSNALAQLKHGGEQEVYKGIGEAARVVVAFSSIVPEGVLQDFTCEFKSAAKSYFEGKLKEFSNNIHDERVDATKAPDYRNDAIFNDSQC